MKSYKKIFTAILFLFGFLSVQSQTNVQYELKYNFMTNYYEAHAHVIGSSAISFPNTIPSPSKFSIVVPVTVSNTPFQVTQNVNPNGMSWSNSNSIFAPSSAPESDFHAFTINGGGGYNAYPLFAPGTDITLFKFTIPGIGYSNDVRLYDNTTDPTSLAPGMKGIDFKQSFKTMGLERYVQGSSTNISGFIYYSNNDSIGLNGVNVKLLNSSNDIVSETVTNNSINNQPGYYNFSFIPNGEYKIVCSYNGMWGGNNSTDALIVQLHTIGIYPLVGLNQVVADVNSSNSISALDALYIKLRTVQMISSYPAGDWKFSTQLFNLTNNPITINVGALCVGDVNGSYVINTTKTTNSVSLIEDGLIATSVGEEFIYEIRSNRQVDIGAMTLSMNYNGDIFEIVDVINEYDMKYNINDNRLDIAWSDVKPLNLNKNDVILKLKMRLKKELSEPTNVFIINPTTEFADVSAIPLNNFDIIMSNVVTPSLDEMVIFNYPNPCFSNTTFVYNLPNSGYIRIVITNIYGRNVCTLIDRYETVGLHTIKIDPNGLNMTPGMYIYKIYFNTQETIIEKSNKLMFIR